MSEHPIVPIEPDQLPLPKKHPIKRSNRSGNTLVLNIKARNAEFNFYKGVNYQVIDHVMGRLFNEDD
ncbi:MAG: hypothetical protein NC453_24380 [Muribaculum sp.]|nr:hypothetical protein [Muribaculum sp.]